ncbi:MAG: hypothetical protein JSW00_05620 [Thermoplasmata archaeon]|nr:MAG: hypothetical protein JSW00_05620 [Thermoplasmata archaeon]
MVFATLFLTKNVNANSTITVLGEFEVYDSDGVTLLSSYDFPFFNGGLSETFYKYFFINNTGSSPVCVYWNISSSSIFWEVMATPCPDRYDHYEEGALKYSFGIYRVFTSSVDYWCPSIEAIFLDVEEVVKLRFELYYTGEPITAETFILTTSFYSGQYPPPMIEATVNIDPDVLVLNSEGKWITAYLELAKGFTIQDIDVNTILLDDVIPAESHPTEIGDYDDDGNLDMMVKFDRNALIEYFQILDVRDGDLIELVVSGKLISGTSFLGTDTIKIIFGSS